MTTPFEFRPVLFAVFWKSGIALSAALCISWMLRTRSADLRRLVFSTTIGLAMWAVRWFVVPRLSQEQASAEGRRASTRLKLPGPPGGAAGRKPQDYAP